MFDPQMPDQIPRAGKLRVAQIADDFLLHYALGRALLGEAGGREGGVRRGGLDLQETFE